MLGVLFYQGIWLIHSLHNSHTHFDGMVREAIGDAVEIYEKKQVFTTFRSKFIKDGVGENDMEVLTHNIVGDSAGKTEVQVVIQRGDTSGINIKRYDSLITIRNSSDTFKYQTSDERHFMVLGDTTQRLASRVGEIVDEIVQEIKMDTMVVRLRLKPVGLDTILRNTLAQKGIDTRFEYALRGVNGILLYQSDGFDEANADNSYKALLFPLHITTRPDELLVQVPDRRLAALKSVFPLLVSSFVFTLVIISTFWLTIRTILKQKKISAIKNDFINNMTHEFKTPLATIGIAADALKGIGGGMGQTSHFAEIIKQESRNMNQKVETILQMALLEQHRVKLALQRADVHEVINQSLQHMALQLEVSNAKIETHLDAAHTSVLADEMHLGNVVANVVDNAIKYSSNHPLITIETRSDDNSVIISISDKGIGMTKEEQKKVFERFYRAQSGNIHATKGFGLGLSYAFEILRLHNGTIEITSEKNKGTTVILTIPRADG